MFGFAGWVLSGMAGLSSLQYKQHLQLRFGSVQPQFGSRPGLATSSSPARNVLVVPRQDLRLGRKKHRSNKDAPVRAHNIAELASLYNTLELVEKRKQSKPGESACLAFLCWVGAGIGEAFGSVVLCSFDRLVLEQSSALLHSSLSLHNTQRNYFSHGARYSLSLFPQSAQLHSCPSIAYL